MEIVELLVKFVDRFDDELADMKEGRLANTAQHLQLQLHVDSEKEKLRTGYDCPDLRQKKVLRQLREWDGKPNGLPAFAMGKFKNKPVDQKMDEGE